MITSLAISRALNHIATVLVDCDLLADKIGNQLKVKTVYDPSLSLTKAYSKVKKLTEVGLDLDSILKKIETKPKQWSLMSWNRGVLALDDRFGLKTFKFIEPIQDGANTVNSYKTRMVSLPITIKFYSNNGNLIEEIEELSIINLSAQTSFEVPVPHIGNMTILMSGIEASSVDKLDTKSTGSMFEYQMDFTLHYMVFADKAVSLPLIRTIFVEVNVGDIINYEFDLGFKKDVESGSIEIYRNTLK